MQLDLGIVRSCLGDRCRVRRLEDGSILEVSRDQRSEDRSRLRFGQLVAVVADPAPAIVWRWHRSQVLVLRPRHALVVLPEGRSVSARLAPCLPAEREGLEEVWVTVVEGAWQVHDAVLAGGPAHPGCLLHWLEEQAIPATAGRRRSRRNTPVNIGQPYRASEQAPPGIPS
jgi:hypothetical protein